MKCFVYLQLIKCWYLVCGMFCDVVVYGMRCGMWFGYGIWSEALVKYSMRFVVVCGTLYVLQCGMWYEVGIGWYIV